MAVIVPTAIGQRYVTGALINRAFTMPAVVSDGDTLVVPENRVHAVTINPTTAVAIGVTIANSTPAANQATLTFKGGPWTGLINVLARIG